MQQDDEVLEPLTEDYVTLYKENELLKRKMRVLVTKLEEYRKAEAGSKDAAATARAQAEKVLRDAEARAQQMLRQAQAQAQAAAQAAAAAAPVAAPAPAAASVSSADSLIAVENARVAEARKAAATRITEIQSQMQACIQALDRIKECQRHAQSRHRHFRSCCACGSCDARCSCDVRWLLWRPLPVPPRLTEPPRSPLPGGVRQ